jgi:UDP-glucose 4-epimerase
MPLRAKIVPYEALPGNYQDVLKRIPDTTKAKRILGFTGKVGLEDGLAATMAWHLARRDQTEALPA